MLGFLSDSAFVGTARVGTAEEEFPSFEFSPPRVGEDLELEKVLRVRPSACCAYKGRGAEEFQHLVIFPYH